MTANIPWWSYGDRVRHPTDEAMLGTIVELDDTAQRARVKWDLQRAIDGEMWSIARNRTWIAYRRLRSAENKVQS